MQPFDRFNIHACQAVVAGLYPPYFRITSSTSKTKTREIYAVGFLGRSCNLQRLAASDPCRSPVILRRDPHPSVVAGPRKSYLDHCHLCLHFLLCVNLASNIITRLPLPTPHLDGFRPFECRRRRYFLRVLWIFLGVSGIEGVSNP